MKALNRLRMVAFQADLLSGIQGIVLSAITLENERAVIHIGSTNQSCPCPRCNCLSFKVHSRYNRTVSDLPLCGISAEARLSVRKFFCTSDACEQKVFSEQFNELVNPYGRRTIRLDQRLTTLGLKAGGNMGASIAMLMGISISSSTLLRLACNMEEVEPETPRALGIDDWAFKKDGTMEPYWLIWKNSNRSSYFQTGNRKRCGNGLQNILG